MLVLCCCCAAAARGGTGALGLVVGGTTSAVHATKDWARIPATTVVVLGSDASSSVVSAAADAVVAKDGSCRALGLGFYLFESKLCLIQFIVKRIISL